ncbi:MAG: maleylacetate reductase [Pseudomonadota bacterium]
MNAKDITLKQQTVLHGAGIRHRLGDIVADMGARRALVLSTPRQSGAAMDLAERLGSRAAGVYSGAVMHTPRAVTDEALEHLRAVRSDCLVALGGGSTIGLSKALSLRTGLPQVVIPTTYAGSEATPILGQTENGVKTTLKDPAVLPQTVLYDPELVASLPATLSVTSGLNAMAHAVEALYAPDRTEATTRQALAGLRAFIAAMPRILDNPKDLDAREESQRAAYACGAVLGATSMALHHKLCHTLGGAFDLPHAETHAIILPHAVDYNASAAPALLAPLSDILGEGAPGPALWRFAKTLNAPRALRDLGVREDQLDRAAELAVARPYPNPREITRAGIRALLQKAWSGEAPV